MNKEQHIEKLATKINGSVYHKGSYNQARDLATIAYDYFNAVESKSMRWVKASERLPEKNYVCFVRIWYIDKRSTYNDIRKFENGKWVGYYDSWGTLHEEKNIAEWLDEPVEKGEDLEPGVQNSEGAAVASHSSTSQSAVEKLNEWLYQKFQEYGLYNTYHWGEYDYEATIDSANCIIAELIKDFPLLLRSEPTAHGSVATDDASSTNAYNQSNTVPIQKYEKLEEALNKINQFSDPGSYEKAIIEMKRIAGLALEK